MARAVLEGSASRRRRARAGCTHAQRWPTPRPFRPSWHRCPPAAAGPSGARTHRTPFEDA